jgi:hypothetical protein
MSQHDANRIPQYADRTQQPRTRAMPLQSDCIMAFGNERIPVPVISPTIKTELFLKCYLNEIELCFFERNKKFQNSLRGEKT